MEKGGGDVAIHPLVFDEISDDGDEWSNERTSGHLRACRFAAPPDSYSTHPTSFVKCGKVKGGDAIKI